MSESQTERCESTSEAGLRCGLGKGHTGTHTALIESGRRWKERFAEAVALGNEDARKIHDLRDLVRELADALELALERNLDSSQREEAQDGIARARKVAP